MGKMLPGSIIQQASLIQTGTVIDEVIDRGAILFSQAPIYWDGANVNASGNIELQLENPNGSFAVNVLPSGLYPLAADQLIIARASRTVGTTTLTAGTYSTLAVGQYCTVALASLTAINLLTKDHYVLFRCRDSSNGVPQLIVPLNKQVLPPGISTNVGVLPVITTVNYADPVSTVLPTGINAFFTGTITGTSTPVTLTANNTGTVGNSINLTFTGSNTIAAAISTWNTANPSNQVTLTGGIGTQIPTVGTRSLSGGTGSAVLIDGTLGVNGNTVLFLNLATGNNQIYTLSGVGSSITWTPLQPFINGVTPSLGNQVQVLSGMIYAGQIGNFTGTQWNFGDTTRFINSAGNYWEQSSLRTVLIVDGSTNTVFSTTALGSENIIVNYSIVREDLKDTGQLFITNNGFSATFAGDNTFITGTGVSFAVALVGGNVVLTYTASAIGETGVMNYFTQIWSDLPGGVAGVPVYSAVTTIPIGYLDSAYVQSDGSAIANNCSQPTVVGGKTQVVLGFFYTVGVNAGSTAGDLEVIVDGEVLPRFLAGVTTTAYYTEINNNTIQMWTDITSPAISIEVRRKAGTVDTASTTGAQFYALYDVVVGSGAQVLSGVATYSSINAAIQASSAGANILVLNGTYSEAVIIDRQVTLCGKGFSTIISGSLTFSGAAANAEVDRFQLIGNLSFSSGSIGNYVNTCWGNAGGTTSDLGTDNTYEMVRN